MPLLKNPLRNYPVQSVALLTLILSASLTLTGCAGGGGGWHMPPPVVETRRVEQQPWTITYNGTGTLEANNRVDLNTEVAGILTHIYVAEGQPVRAGQVLMRFKADKQLAQVQEAAAGISMSQSNIEQQKADIRQAKAQLDSAEARMNLAKSELVRFEKLYLEEFVSQLELEQKRNAYDTASAAYREAVQHLSSAKASYDQASSALAQSRSSYQYNKALAAEALVRAPFNGVAGKRFVDLGDYVAPTEKLMTVVDPSRFKLQFTVPERYIGQLKRGLPVRATFEGLGERIYQGQIRFIDPVVDREAHTILVKAILPGSSELKDGLFGKVSLSLGSIPGAVVIPEEAVVPQGEKSFVYVLRRETIPDEPAAGKKANKKEAPASHEGNVAHLQEIQIGYREAGRVEVRSGLKPGERIITSGLQKVSDKLEVNPDGMASAGETKGH